MRSEEIASITLYAVPHFTLKTLFFPTPFPVTFFTLPSPSTLPSLYILPSYSSLLSSCSENNSLLNNHQSSINVFTCRNPNQIKAGGNRFTLLIQAIPGQALVSQIQAPGFNLVHFAPKDIKYL